MVLFHIVNLMTIKSRYVNEAIAGLYQVCCMMNSYATIPILHCMRSN